MPEQRIERARFCSQCGGAVVVRDANFCKECGAPLPNTVWLNPTITWNPWTAALLSVVPGLGHWYRGAWMRGFAWFVAVLFFYGLAPAMGLLIHLICAGNAALDGALREDALSARRGRRHSPGLAASARAPR
jgi:hypothetical protein